MLEILYEYIKNNNIFTTEEIAKELSITNKDTLNVYLERLCKKEEIYRYERGVYGRVEEIAFLGKKIHPSKREVVNHLYIHNNQGYVGEGDYILEIGLSTWCPSKRTVYTNAVTRTQQKYDTILKKPKTFINAENYKYLRLLDCIENYNEYPIDAKKPSDIIIREINREQLDVMLLLATAQKYYKKETLQRLLEFIKEFYYETA